jgi:hypothetical protein
MQDLEDALSDIRTMRSQLARSTQFRGYSATAFAATGVLALAAAGLQSVWIANATADVAGFIAIWIAAAVIAVAIIGIDVVARSRRDHDGLADEMIYAALEQLLPAAVAGALLTCVIVRFAPQSAWMLPGLWQILLSLGVFASCRSLPPQLVAVAVWYLATGLICIASADATNALSPWTMGAPFAVGQLLAAALIYKFGGGDANAEE